MNGTWSNSLAKVNYSGAELSLLPNFLLGAEIVILFYFFHVLPPFSLKSRLKSLRLKINAPIAQGILGKQLVVHFSGRSLSAECH